LGNGENNLWTNVLKGKYSRRFNVAQAMDYKGTDSPLWIDIVKHSAPLVKEE